MYCINHYPGEAVTITTIRWGKSVNLTNLPDMI